MLGIFPGKRLKYWTAQFKSGHWAPVNPKNDFTSYFNILGHQLSPILSKWPLHCTEILRYLRQPVGSTKKDMSVNTFTTWSLLSTNKTHDYQLMRPSKETMS